MYQLLLGFFIALIGKRYVVSIVDPLFILLSLFQFDLARFFIYRLYF